MTSTPVSFSGELVETFVGAAWALPLSADERISLMTTLPFVNSTWRDAYMRASCKDIYIPCDSYCPYLFSILWLEYPEHCQVHNDKAAVLIGMTCRSITFLIDRPSVPPQECDLERPGGPILSEFFHLLPPDSLPRLRKVYIHYLNKNFDDFFENWQSTDFPPQVDFFEVKHAFSPKVPPFLVSALRDRHHAPLGFPMRLPNVKHLSLEDVGSDYIADMVTTCSNLQVLELKLAPDTDVFIRLPNSVESIILHAPDNADLSMHRLPAPNTFPLQLPRVGHSCYSRWLSLQPCTAYQLVCAGVKDDMYTLAMTYPS